MVFTIQNKKIAVKKDGKMLNVLHCSIFVEAELKDLKGLDFETFPQDVILCVTPGGSVKIDRIEISKLESGFLIETANIFCAELWESYDKMADYVARLEHLLDESEEMDDIEVYEPDETHLGLSLTKIVDKNEDLVAAIQSLMSTFFSVSNWLDLNG